MLASARDQALLLPGAEDAAHRVKRRPGHLRHVLAADREVDLDALGGLTAGLLGQPEQRMRHPALDLLGGHLHHPGVRLLQPASHRLERVGRHRRVACDEAGQALDGQASTTLSTTAVAVAG